jgi:hypothetical protein
MRRVVRGFVCVALSFLLVSVTALGQVTTRVTGIVQDKTGAAIAGAAVTLTNEATKVSFNTVTSSVGTYVFDGVQPGRYKINAEMKGFKSFVAGDIAVTIGQPAVVNATLEVGAVTETVEVKEAAELVQTNTSGNFGNLVDQISVTTLPIVGLRGRNALNFVELQPGVVDGGPNITGGGVSVHGSRDRAWNYTLDGIDINETSAGGSNFSPLRTNPDSIAQFRVLTGNFTSEYGRNSGGEVLMVTRSGTNEYHGTGFFFYQTPGLLANDPGNKSATPPLDRPQFVQKIPGFSLGGPIIKNKTFFFTNLQVLRTLQTRLTTSTVYTDSARRGLFRYVTGGNCGNPCRNRPAGTAGASVDASGNVLPGVNVASYNVVANDPQAAGLDPQIQKILGLTPLPNDFGVGDGLDVAGFDFLATQLEKQVDWTIKIDHSFNSRHFLFVRWAHGHQNTDGDTVNNGSAPFPGAPDVVATRRSPRNLSVNWRWNPKPVLTNEFVVGMNRFIFDFLNPDPKFAQNPPFVLNNLITLPLQNYVGNKRALTTYQLVDNMTYLRGAHSFKWGINFRYQRHIDDRGSIGSLNAAPSVNLDPGINNVDPVAFNLPTNINATFDLPSLKGTINDLLGRVGEIDQGLAAISDTQYGSPGTHLRFDFRMPEYDFYVQDSWRLRPNLVLDFGLRWEIRLSPRNTQNAILRPDQPFGIGVTPSNTLKWVPGQLYNDAFHSLGPSIGLAWDPFGTGKTSIRANYRLAHDRINTFSLSSSVFQFLPGLALQLTNRSFGQAGGRIRNGVPTLTPGGVTPAQLRQPSVFSTNTITVMDSNWQPAQVHEWGLSFQREVPWRIVVDLNYVGRKGVHLYGGYDANQVDLFKNGFLSAFQVMQAGGDSPLINQLLSMDSRRPGGLSGSQWMRTSGSPYFAAFSRGSVTEVAAAISQRAQGNPPVPLVVLDGLSPFFFMAFPQFAGALNVLDSNDFSTYHAFEAQVRRPFSGGLTFQASYTWARSLDTRSFDPTFSTVRRGIAQAASSTPYDIRNRRLNYAPSDFDRTHVFQANWVWELPFGAGRRWGHNWNSFIERVFGGWEIAGIGTIETGRPFTIYSAANTTSQAVRTPANCTGCSPYMGQIHSEPTLQGFNAYFTAAQNTLFTTPAPGQQSNVGRNAFRLGHFRDLDMAVGKKTRITERQNLELRLEIQNFTNSVMYDLPESATITSSAFGRLNQTNVGLASNARRMQISAKYSF